MAYYEVTSPEEVNKIYSSALERGAEGLVLRHPDRPYKYGRSTMREQGMMKYKPIFDAESVAEIEGDLLAAVRSKNLERIESKYKKLIEAQNILFTSVADQLKKDT